MRTNLLCKCGATVRVTKQQANSTVQCLSCLGRVLIPPEKVLVSLRAFHRDRRLRIFGMIVLGLCATLAAATGIYAQSERDRLLADVPATVREQIQKTRQVIARTENEARINGGNPESDARLLSLRDLLMDLEAPQFQNREDVAEVEIKDVTRVFAAVDADQRTATTNAWLAGALAAEVGEALQYAFIAGAGGVFLLLILLSARISSHRHRIITHEKQTHSKILNP